MKKKSYNPEIDIIEMFSVISSRKLQIILIYIFFIISGLLFYSNQKLTNNTNNNEIYYIALPIQPISLFEESEYSEYNYYFSDRLNIFKNLDNFNSGTSQMSNSKDHLRMQPIFINRETLYKYFVSQFMDKFFLENEMTRFFIKLDKDKKYTNKQEVIQKIVKSTRVIQDDTVVNSEFKNYKLEIQTQKSEINTLKLFFAEYENLINYKLKKFFVKEFNKAIQNQLSKIYYESVRANELMLNFNSAQKDTVGNLKKEDLLFYSEYLEKTQEIEEIRSKKILENTPLISENFKAARLDFSALTTKIKKNINQKKFYTIKTIIFSSLFFGTIFSILYVIIICSFRNKFLK